MRTEETSTSVETRRLKADDALIYHIIFRQAGTLAKALLEGVMNSVDAGATKVDIRLDNKSFSISDDGRGFDSLDSIERFFETFGTAHELDEDGVSKDARFGTFRIGRGQLFAFADTDWRSGPFRMSVDVKNKGLDWELEQGLPEFEGCRIEGSLYDRLSHAGIRETTRTLSDFVRWVDVPVTLNGDVVSKDPAASEWDVETSDFRLKVQGVSGVDIYQQGVYVTTVPHHLHGISAVVVTKRPLVLNTARNDVLHSCPVWRKIRKALNKLGGSTIERKARSTGQLDAGDRAAVFEKIAARARSARSCAGLPLFEDSTGRTWSANQIGRMSSERSAWGKLPDGNFGIAFAPSNSAVADGILQRKAGLVLSEGMPSLAGFDEGDQQSVMHLLRRMVPYAATYRIRLCGLDELSPSEGDYRPVQANSLSEREFRLLRCIGDVGYVLARVMTDLLGRGSSDRVNHRTVLAGESSIADGWTDGRTFICINRKFLSPSKVNEAWFHRMTALLIHEYCHLENSAGDHGHPPEFYRLFHDTLFEIGPDLGRQSWMAYCRWIKAEAKKFPKALSDDLSREADAAYDHTILGRLEAQAK